MDIDCGAGNDSVELAERTLGEILDRSGFRPVRFHRYMAARLRG